MSSLFDVLYWVSVFETRRKGAMSVKVVIVDDDEFKRAGMAHRLGWTSEIEVVETLDQDTAAARHLTAWDPIDTVLVDVCDDQALGEVGTDVYSGINVVERVYPIRTFGASR